MTALDSSADPSIEASLPEQTRRSAEDQSEGPGVPPEQAAPPALSEEPLWADVPPEPWLARWRGRLGSLEALALVLIVVVVGRGGIVGRFASPRMLELTTVLLSLVLQALPFLVLGIAFSRALTAFLPETLIAAGLRRDLPAALVTSPALSPVVLASTWVAFPGHPVIALARALAGAAAAVFAALLWRRVAGRPPRRPTPAPRGVAGFLNACRDDLVRSGGGLIAGAVVVSAIAAALPVRWLDTLAAYPGVAIAMAGLLAVLLSQRAEVDAVLAAAFVQFPLTARLVFLVVGPVVNLRRFARWAARPADVDSGVDATSVAVRYAITGLLAAAAIGGLTGWAIL